MEEAGRPEESTDVRPLMSTPTWLLLMSLNSLVKTMTPLTTVAVRGAAPGATPRQARRVAPTSLLRLQSDTVSCRERVIQLDVGRRPIADNRLSFCCI